MTRPYLILVNGKLWDRKLTERYAVKVAQELRDKGLKASVAYECTTGDRQVVHINDFNAINSTMGA